MKIERNEDTVHCDDATQFNDAYDFSFSELMTIPVFCDNDNSSVGSVSVYDRRKNEENSEETHGCK